MLFLVYFILCFFFFFKQKTAYEMRISDWSSDVCSSDLNGIDPPGGAFSRQACVNPLAEQSLEFQPCRVITGIGGEQSLDSILLDRLSLNCSQGLQALVLLIGDVDGQAAHSQPRLSAHPHITTNVRLW